MDDIKEETIQKLIKNYKKKLIYDRNRYDTIRKYDKDFMEANRQRARDYYKNNKEKISVYNQNNKEKIKIKSLYRYYLNKGRSIDFIEKYPEKYEYLKSINYIT
tara:strand:- start:2556 stop:2867 length:312 start_codon:yes stop_codon:yes gene_type:complete